MTTQADQSKSAEKRLNGYLTLEEHQALNAKLKALTGEHKVSVSDYVIATLDIPNQVLQPYVDKVIDKKYKSKKVKRSLADKIAGASEATRRQIEELLAREITG